MRSPIYTLSVITVRDKENWAIVALKGHWLQQHWFPQAYLG